MNLALTYIADINDSEVKPNILFTMENILSEELRNIYENECMERYNNFVFGSRSVIIFLDPKEPLR